MRGMKRLCTALLLCTTYACGSRTPSSPSETAALKELSLAASSAVGGTQVIGTVRLTVAAPAGGATVSVVSNSVVASTPGTVMVPAGQTAQTFVVSTSSTAANQAVTLTAGYLGVNTTAALAVTTATPSTTVALQSLTLSAPSTVSGGTLTGTLTLDGPAPTGGIVVALSSDQSVVTVPASVTVAAGQVSQTFTVTTGTPPSTWGATLMASYQGVSRTALMTVLGPGLGYIAGTWSGRLNAFTGVPTGTPSSPAYYQVTYTISGTEPSLAGTCSLTDAFGTTLATNRSVTFTPTATAGHYNAACVYQAEISFSSVADQVTVDTFNRDWHGGLNRP